LTTAVGEQAMEQGARSGRDLSGQLGGHGVGAVGELARGVVDPEEGLRAVSPQRPRTRQRAAQSPIRPDPITYPTGRPAQRGSDLVRGELAGQHLRPLDTSGRGRGDRGRRRLARRLVGTPQKPRQNPRASRPDRAILNRVQTTMSEEYAHADDSGTRSDDHHGSAGAGVELYSDAKWQGATPEVIDALELYDTVYSSGLGDPTYQKTVKGCDDSFLKFADRGRGSGDAFAAARAGLSGRRRRARRVSRARVTGPAVAGRPRHGPMARGPWPDRGRRCLCR
jgi:hypothetical protein